MTGSWGQRTVSLALAATLITGLMVLAWTPAAPAAIAATAPVTAYVTTLGLNGTGESVTPINLATNTAGSPIPFTNGPQGIAFSPDGSTVYVTNFNGNTITPINTATNTLGTPITVGLEPQAIVVTPDGVTAYVILDGPGAVVPVIPEAVELVKAGFVVVVTVFLVVSGVFWVCGTRSRGPGAAPAAQRGRTAWRLARMAPY
jgi:YVTN family beta-propeller protein